jgi:hypothetical protein
MVVVIDRWPSHPRGGVQSMRRPVWIRRLCCGGRILEALAWLDEGTGDIAQIVRSAGKAGCEGIFPKKYPNVCRRDLILT